jgi:hypothetical protein
VQATISDTHDILRPFRDRLRDKKVLVMEGSAGYTQGPDGCGSKYDVVVLPATSGAQTPLLTRAAGFLAAGGALMICLKNGKQQFRELAGQAGFLYCSFYYPFPTIESPEVLLSEGAFDSPAFDVGNLIEPVLRNDGYAHMFIRGLLASGLMRDLGDDLFAVASNNADWLPAQDVFAWTFNSGRALPYRKMTIFYRGKDGDLRVRRQRYDSEAASGCDGPVRQELQDEPYLTGRLYSLELAEIVSRAGWAVDDLAVWARRYLSLLTRYADKQGRLDGRYLDLVPFNLVEGAEGLRPIDLEWVAPEPLPVSYVFFRGIYHSLARAGGVAMPLEATPMNLYGLCLAIAGQVFPSTELMLENFVALEPRYFGVVFDGDARPPGDTDLMVRQRMVPQAPADRLYPLPNLNVQVFIERPGQGFSEETSTMLRIGLSEQRKVYSVLLPFFADDIVRLRIDPSDHCGLLLFHALHLRSEGNELFYWMPYSRTDVEVNGVLLLNGGASLPSPVMVLLDHDPMLIFPMPGVNRKDPAAPVVLEIEVSALTPALYGTVRNCFAQLCEMLPRKLNGML